MTIIIADTKIDSTAQLPDNVQSILQIVPQGESWFNTVSNDSKISIVFGSVDLFVEQLLIGLHGFPLVYLHHMDLFIGAQKLMTISNNDVRDILGWQQAKILSSTTATNIAATPVGNKRSRQTQVNNESDWSAALAALMSKYQLVSNEILAQYATDFNTSHGIGNNPLAWGATLEQQLVCHQTLKYAQNAFKSTTQQHSNGCQWAMTKAQTLSEFGHYYCCYLAWESQRTQGQSGLGIDAIMAQLMTLVEHNIDCPIVTMQLDEKGLQSAVRQWNEQDKTLGFSGLSCGLLNIMLNIDLTTDNAAIQSQGAAYIKSLQIALNSHLAKYYSVNQSGSLLQYLYDLTERTMVVQLDPIGCLSLNSDWPKLSNHSEQVKA